MRILKEIDTEVCDKHQRGSRYKQLISMVKY